MLHAILLLQLAAPPLQAQQAEELVHASIRDYDLGYFEEALREAEQAYRLYPLAQILFNVGQCHRALKHWDKAAFFYQRYLSKLPDAANREQVEALLAEADYHIKLDALRPKPAPPEPGVVVVSPKPVPAPVTTSVPPAALEPSTQKTVEVSRPHTTAYVLGTVAVVSLAFMVVGIVEVESFESVVGQLGNPTSFTTWQVDHTKALSQLTQAQVWEAVSFASGALAVGTGTGAVLTW